MTSSYDQKQPLSFGSNYQNRKRILSYCQIFQFRLSEFIEIYKVFFYLNLKQNVPYHINLRKQRILFLNSFSFCDSSTSSEILLLIIYLNLSIMFLNFDRKTIAYRQPIKQINFNFEFKIHAVIRLKVMKLIISRPRLQKK